MQELSLDIVKKVNGGFEGTMMGIVTGLMTAMITIPCFVVFTENLPMIMPNNPFLNLIIYYVIPINVGGLIGLGYDMTSHLYRLLS